jgi:hypothetical protein
VGLFLYANSTPGIEIDDRTLAHLRVVMFAKLRRDESFGFSWDSGSATSGGRGAAWICPGVPLQMIFYGNEHVHFNRTWLEQLTDAANSNTGLHILHEPTDVWKEH